MLLSERRMRMSRMMMGISGQIVTMMMKMTVMMMTTTITVSMMMLVWTAWCTHSH